MRFIVFEKAGTPCLAVVDGESAIDLALADPRLPRDLDGLVGLGGLEAVRAAVASAGADARVALAGLSLLPPIARPGKIVCLGLNYVDHAKEGGFEVPDYPALFMRSMTSLVGAGQPIVRPRCSERLDYEAELMVVIGRGGRHIPEDQALERIFGYTIFNDGSVRDYQRKTHQWTPGKNFDATGAIGPLVVTPDELPDGGAGLAIRTRLNGEVLQDGNTSDMVFDVRRTIAILSEVMTLEPGDLIAMGTPPGVGHARRPPLWMKAGDTVEIEIEGIGVLRNPIADEPDAQVGVAAQ